MKVVLVLTLLAVVAQAVPHSRRHVVPKRFTLPLIPGAPKYGPAKITGGDEATPGQFPYQIGMFVDNAWFCGGSILSETWILTAAHCARDGRSFEVTVGAHNIYNDGTTIRTTNKVVHTGFDGVEPANDIAVLRLPEALVFSDTVNKIALVSRSEVGNDFVGQSVRVSGWGATNDFFPTVSTTLNYVDLTVITNSECAQTFGSSIVSSIVCTRGTGNKSTCSGDSGGPLVVGPGGTTSFQIGVVSFGPDTGCENGDPTGFTRVTDFLDWLEQNTDLTIP